jgi:hypothetical protein
MENPAELKTYLEILMDAVQSWHRPNQPHELVAAFNSGTEPLLRSYIGLQ